MYPLDPFQIQLKPGGKWHRRNRVQYGMTACGEFVLGPVKSRDRGNLRAHDNHMCEICWPKEEIETARTQRLHRVADALLDEDEEATNPDVDVGEIEKNQ